MENSAILILGLLVLVLLIVIILTAGGWKKAHIKVFRIIEIFFEK